MPALFCQPNLSITSGARMWSGWIVLAVESNESSQIDNLTDDATQGLQ